MANREIGQLPLIVYLVTWWGLVLAAFFWLTSNHAPGAPELAFKEKAYFVTTKLTVDVAKAAPDADGDAIEYEYTWRRNGEVVEDEIASALSPGQIREGDVWQVTVEPNDGSKGSFACGLIPSWRTCAGEVVGTAEVTIANTPPLARIRVQNAKGEDVSTLRPGEDLVLKLSCYDPDLIQRERDAEAAALAAGTPPAVPVAGAAPVEKPDPCSYKIAWYAGDAPPIVEPGTQPDPAAGTADAAVASATATPPATTPAEPITPKFTDVLTVSAKDLKASKIWHVQVVANDGAIDGSTAEVVLQPPSDE